MSNFLKDELDESRGTRSSNVRSPISVFFYRIILAVVYSYVHFYSATKRIAVHVCVCVYPPIERGLMWSAESISDIRYINSSDGAPAAEGYARLLAVFNLRP